MASKITYEYTLEQLTTSSVNVLSIARAKVDGKIYELERSRRCYANSPTGRQQVSEALPENIVNVILAMWGDTPTVPDPEYGGD